MFALCFYATIERSSVDIMFALCSYVTLERSCVDIVYVRFVFVCYIRTKRSHAMLKQKQCRHCLHMFVFLYDVTAKAVSHTVQIFLLRVRLLMLTYAIVALFPMGRHLKKKKSRVVFVRTC